jgi:hypothetical protein
MEESNRVQGQEAMLKTWAVMPPKEEEEEDIKSY